MDKEQLKKIENQFSLAALAALIIVTIGVLFYHFVEELSYIDALYFSVITLTTVGYGDIAPQTDIGKLFTVGYIVAGVAIIGTFANLLIKRAAIHRMNKSEEQ